MSRAYREEFARIMGANNKGFLEASPQSQLLKPPFLGAPMFPGMEGFPRPSGDIQTALSMYQEELSRLQQHAMASAIKEQERGSEDGRGTPGEENEAKQTAIKQDPIVAANAALKIPKSFPFPQSPKMEDSTSGSPLQVSKPMIFMVIFILL